MSDSVDKKGVFKIMSLALAVAIVGIVFLGWQYRLLEKKQLPALENKIEENSARDVLRLYLQTRADVLLTEEAMDQKLKEEFTLGEDSRYYEILRVEKISDGKFKFYVKVNDFIEIITLTKILDSYYIDSIQTAG